MKKLGFGFMRLPQTVEGFGATVDTETVKKMVDTYIERGFNYFDTGYVYHMGQSEIAVKEAVVARHPRESVIIADKMPIWMVQSHTDYKRYFDEQRGRLGVEYIDNYLFHAFTLENYRSTVKHDGFSFMMAKKSEGSIRNYGFSWHDSADNLEIVLSEQPDVDFVQLQLNYRDWDNVTVESRRCYEVATKHNIPVIVMEPVKGGLLAEIPPEAEKIFKDIHPDWSIASWAIRFAASLPNVQTVLSGMTNKEQLDDNTSYMADFVPLNEQEHNAIAEVTEILKANPTIPCTSCRYCVEHCPKNIPIPKYFAMFNDSKSLGARATGVYYTSLTQSYGKASDCIACGKCAEHCPQHIAKQICAWYGHARAPPAAA